MTLRYLTFTADDDGGDRGCWEAMASTPHAALPEVRQEIAAVLRWAEQHAPGPQGPEEDGGTWDVFSHTQDEGRWVTVTVTLTGPLAWGASLLARFAPPDSGD
ncbi:MAG: hypothetical protein ACK5W4_06105 [Inhella sp.]|uniref:hypothetical protein n=1 Tax=Inhella sp. TaxID=1921806 RepID=UPI00391F4B07